MPEKLRPCMRKGCAQPALWTPVLVLSASVAKYGEHPPARAGVGLELCDEHRTAADIFAEFLDHGDNWQRIVSGFDAAGRARPERELARIEWQRLP